MVSDKMPSSSKQTTTANQTVNVEPVTPPASKWKRKATTPAKDPQGFSVWDTSDD